MKAESISLEDIDQGLDRKQLKRLRQRFLELNSERYRRMLAGLTERQQDLVALLPLLFHVNHPMLPGYVSADTPAGLSHYRPDKNEIRRARVLARSFDHGRELRERRRSIEALFVMGSVGTVAQSESSDLDVWVCHDPALDGEARRALAAKCRLLGRWASEQLRLDVHFFLMDPARFRAGELGELSAEGSGSTQRFLLLDEFYRTALWLGGKLPLWWFVPAAREGDYEHYAQTLLHRRFVRPDEVIDFGGVPAIPEDEFVGAGIWHLYKGIDTPHKSVLKLMLLEAYTHGEDPRPLSLAFKESVCREVPRADRLDPYVMIYRCLEAYLRDSPERLALARRCLYFKADKALTRPPRGGSASWQRRLMESLVEEWGWRESLLQRLDRRRQWKAPEVAAERRALVAELSSSYRLISALQQGSAQTRVNDEELTVLGRKLHAAFERKAGKVEWINPGISLEIAEPALVFEQEPPPAPGVQRHWSLFRARDGRAEGESLKRARHLTELLIWAYCNGVLTAGTWFDVRGDQLRLSAPQRQQLWQWFEQWLPLPPPANGHDRFQQPARAERLLLVFNLGVEPQQALHERGLQMLSDQSDAFDFSGLRDNLVRTLDLVQINSWGELVCRHFERDALADGLHYCLRLAPPGRGLAPPELTIRCTGAQGALVVQRLESLWQDLVGVYHSGTRPPGSRYVLETADSYLLIQFLQQQPQVTRIGRYQTLIDKLSHTQFEYSPIVVDRQALRDRPLALMAERAREPGVYLFYRVRGEWAEVTLIDEMGSLLETRLPFHSHKTLLRPLHYFLQSVLARQSASVERASGESVPGVQLYEICGEVEQGRGYLETRESAGRIDGLTFTQVQVIAEPGPEDEILYTIYCDDREFSALDWGEELFAEVARYILSRRRGEERYPCYITDLDLTQCRDQLAPQRGLQLSHYLDQKARLEQALNRALEAL